MEIERNDDRKSLEKLKKIEIRKLDYLFIELKKNVKIEILLLLQWYD